MLEFPLPISSGLEPSGSTLQIAVPSFPEWKDQSTRYAFPPADQIHYRRTGIVDQIAQLRAIGLHLQEFGAIGNDKVAVRRPVEVFYVFDLGSLAWLCRSYRLDRRDNVQRPCGLDLDGGGGLSVRGHAQPRITICVASDRPKFASGARYHADLPASRIRSFLRIGNHEHVAFWKPAFLVEKGFGESCHYAYALCGKIELFEHFGIAEGTVSESDSLSIGGPGRVTGKIVIVSVCDFFTEQRSYCLPSRLADSKLEYSQRPGRCPQT